MGRMGQGSHSGEMLLFCLPPLHTMGLHRNLLRVVDLPKYSTMALDSKSAIKRKNFLLLEKSEKRVIFVRLAKDKRSKKF